MLFFNLTSHLYKIKDLEFYSEQKKVNHNLKNENDFYIVGFLKNKNI